MPASGVSEPSVNAPAACTDARKRGFRAGKIRDFR